MSCPCGLSQERVLEVDKKHGVPLVGGKCQNPLADGAEGICGKALGAHPLAQGRDRQIRKMSSIDFSSVETYCQGKFKRVYDQLTIDQQISINDQFRNERPGKSNFIFSHLPFSPCFILYYLMSLILCRLPLNIFRGCKGWCTNC